MRIGIVCPYNYFLPGGVQEHVKSQAKVLESHGHFVRVITPRPRNFSDPAPRGVVFIGQSRRIRAQSTEFAVSSVVEGKEIDELYADLNLDIVHFHEPFIPFVPRQLVLQATCPVVSSFHAAMPESIVSRSISSFRPYLKPILEASARVIAVSPVAAEHLWDLHTGDIHFISNGIDLNHYKKQRINRDIATVLFIGRLEKRKGTRYLLDAFKEVKEHMPHAQLQIAGDGNLRNYLERYVESNGINGVTFLGYIDEKQKQSLLSRCTIFCSPALYGESFGIVLLEAMALGAPIVAHGNPGYEWVLQKTGRLSLVNVKDTEEFARRIELLMEDTELRSVWLDWSKEYVNQFSYEHIVADYEKLYTEVIKEQ